MPQLRWALAALGALFLGGLTWWELRRARQGVRAEIQPITRESLQFSAQPIAQREPSVPLPEVRALPEMEVLDDRALIGQIVHGEGADPFQSVDPLEETQEQLEAVEPIVLPPEPRAPFQSVLERASVTAHAGPVAPVPVAPVPVAPVPVAPVVEWPRESERRLIALRIVAPGERFPGRAVRQALAAEGFVLGKFAIFHRCGPDGRAVVSAASLTNPGTFDLDSIDMQRFGGLNLFAVLPGPLPPVRAFEQLLASARNLSERLQGALQDETGEPLTPLRAAALRELLGQDEDQSRG